MTKNTYGTRGLHERKEIVRAGIFSFVIVLLTMVGIGLVGKWNEPDTATTSPTVAAGFPGAGSPFPAAPVAPSTTTTTTSSSSSAG